MAALRQEQALNLAEEAVKTALKKGADEAEAFIFRGESTGVGIELGQIVRSARTVDQGIGIRTIVSKATGFAYTNMLNSKATVEEAIARALSSAKASKPDKNWHSLPAKKPLSTVKKTYDPKIVNLRPEDLVQFAARMLDTAEETDKRVSPIEGGVGTGCFSEAVANSNGVGFVDRGTAINCSLVTVAKDGNETTPVCVEFNAERSFNIDPEWVAREASHLAISALKAKKTETKTTNIVFTQFALQELMQYAFINSVKADYVQRGQSSLKGKIGEKVASELVNIHDDGLFEGGLLTGRFDGEGAPRQRTCVIDKGVLRSFIYDSYTAHKESRESTGNAARSGYLSTPSVEPTNFHLASGRTTPEDIISEVDDGLIMYNLQGAHSSNPVSGDFSVVATPAWKIEKGELAYSVKGAMVAGNIFEVLKNVSALANNERKFGQLVAPWVLSGNVKVIGK